LRAYEAVVVLAPTLDEAGCEAILERAARTITEQGGTVTHVDRWGRRRLAYEIAGHKDAFYAVIYFQAPAGATAELERILRITDNVLRYLVVLAVPGKRPAAAEGAEAAEAAPAPAGAPSGER
jgi:small subunit ribosomal protein S6